MSLWDALTDIQKKVSEGVEQFQEVFDPNAAVPPPRTRPVPSAAFSVDNDDSTCQRPAEHAPRKTDVSSSKDVPPKPQTTSAGASRSLASASRDELAALVQRQAAKIHQLQGRLDDCHQENQVLRQERDTLKNMLRASDAELTEVKRSVVSASSTKSADDAASAVSLKSRAAQLQPLAAGKLHCETPDNLSDVQLQLESALQQNQKLLQHHEAALHTALERVSRLESTNCQLSAEISASRHELSQAAAASSVLKSQLIDSQAHTAASEAVISELRTKVLALEASLATYSAIAASNVGIECGSVPAHNANLPSTSPSTLRSELQSQTANIEPLPHELSSGSERVTLSTPGDASQVELLKARALAESATSDASAARAQLLEAESRISELVAKLNECQLNSSKLEHDAVSAGDGPLAQRHQHESTDADVAAMRSEVEDLISAIDHLSRAVASVNFPNQPALPTHSLPCHLSKAAFASFKQLADAVDAVVSQLVRCSPLVWCFLFSHAFHAGRRRFQFSSSFQSSQDI
jgi:molecular chaperone GrpE (heat shock protein)